MDLIYTQGANLIKTLQDLLPCSGNYFVQVSEIADPAKAFSIIFPISCVFSLSLGAELLTASVAAEWTNILLKLFLMEHRPYWWVNLAPGRPILMQTKSTCETGPGSPSGHLTGMTVVCYVTAQWMCKLINEETLIGRLNKRRLNRLIWFSVYVILVNVTLSRMYHATHFPHQCLLGIFAGHLIGSLLCGNSSKYAKWWKNRSKTELIVVSFILAVIGIMAYLVQILFGINPDWSIHLASKWCQRAEYLHVSTMPQFSLVRDIGTSFGIALCSPVSKRINCPYNRSVSAVLTFFVYVALQLATKGIPRGDSKIFYSSYFVLSATQPYFMLVIIPYVSYLISKLKQM